MKKQLTDQYGEPLTRYEEPKIVYKIQHPKQCPICHRSKTVETWTTNNDLKTIICKSCDYNYKNGGGAII